MSYQENDVAEYINEALVALDLMPPSGESVVVVADFAASHLDSNVIAHLKNKGIYMFMLPSALTPVTQVNDTCLHSHFELVWAMEKQQRDLRPAQLDWLRFARKLSQWTQ